MTWSEIRSIVLGVLIQKLPTFIMKRIYTLEDLKGDIDISIRGTGDPVTFNLHGIPEVNVYFRVTNLSYLDIEVEIFFVSLWLKGKGKISKQEVHFREPQIRARSIRDMLWNTSLNEYQVKIVDNYFKETKKDIYCDFDVNARISSTIGRLSIEKNLENIRCRS